MQFSIEETKIPEVKLIQQFKAGDQRGEFIKTFHKKDYVAAGIDFTLRESFYSVSAKNVIRGMHFHHPPFAHQKLVFCTHGCILDVALDLRTHSPTYGQSVSAELSQHNSKALWIPEGFAHGFLTLSDTATTFYLVSGEYQSTADDGVHFNSFGFDWPVKQPILSARDLGFKPLNEFISPF